MAFIKKFISQQELSRREFLISSSLGTAAVAGSSLFSPSLMASSGPAMAWSYRNRSNDYWNAIVTGGESFLTSLGMDKSALTHLINEGSSEKSLADVKALMAKNNGNVALAIDANDSPNARPVVEATKSAGGYVSTIWNKTDDLHPWDFGDNYVAHLAWNGVAPAEETARAMIKQMGGKGRIVGLGGIPSNAPAIERKQGLMNVLKEFPEVELLDFQAADWSTQKANEVMSSFITRFGDIDGVFAANDSMAIGAVEALRAEGLAGQIAVAGFDGTPQAIQMIESGEMCATVDTNPGWGGGILLAITYHAAIGTFKPSDEPKSHREFWGGNVVVTTDDVAAYKKKYIEKTPTYDWNDFWGPTTSPWS